MQATSAAEAIVHVWEQGQRQAPLQRTLTILSVLSGVGQPDLAAQTIERRDAALLAWRAWLFGDLIAGYDVCPRCGCGVDVAVAAPAPEPPEDAPAEVEVGGRRITVRLPTTVDLAAVASAGELDVVAATLLRRCATADDGEALTEEELAAADGALDARAGVASASVALSCPDCGHAWDRQFDVGAFAWREIEIHAVRLLRDVDTLARRYGWTSHEVLSLSTARRRFFLELAAS